ncbi:MAG: TetR/AcrR family transcriptional regulator [Bryobacteraceae bacterium]|nr:TetR/AcrR family transcriptional regulator [Bryobacteraceae bacterium]
MKRHERRLLTRATLVEAAEEVFLREGFERASVEQITAAAGFTRGAFYSNFRDKDEVAIAVIDSRCRDAANALKIWDQVQDPAEQWDQFRTWFKDRQWQTNWIALRAELSRRALWNPALRERLSELCRQEMRVTAASLVRWKPSCIDRSPEVTALALIAASQGLGSLCVHAEQDLEVLSDTAAQLVFDCLTGARVCHCEPRPE